MHQFGLKFRYVFRAAFVFAAVFVSAAILLAAAAPFAVERPQVRDALIKRLEAWTGGNVTIDGPIRLGSLIALTVEAQRVHLSETPKLQPMARMDAQSVKAIISFAALIEGRFDFEKIVVTSAKIVLKRDVAAEWAAGNLDGGVIALPLDFAAAMPFTELVFRRSTFFVPMAQRRPFRDVFSPKLRISKSASGVRNIDGQIRVGDRRWQFAMRAGAESGGKTVVSTSMKATAYTASFGGEFDRPAQSLTGNLSYSGLLPAAFAPEIATNLMSIETGPSLAVSGVMTVQQNKVMLDNANIRIGNHSATGSLALNVGKIQPKLEGTLAFDSLKVSTAIGLRFDEEKSGFQLVSDAKPVRGPLFSGVDVDLRVSSDRLQIDNIAGGPFAAAFNIESDRASVDIAELGLFGGVLRGRADYKRGAGGVDEINLKGSGLHTDMAAFADSLSMRPIVSGVADFSMGVTAAAEPGFVSLRSGRFRFDLPDGGSIREALVAPLETALATQKAVSLLPFTNGATPLSSLTVEGAIDRDKVSSQISAEIEGQIFSGAVIVGLPGGSVSGRLVAQDDRRVDAGQTTAPPAAATDETGATILISGTATNPSFTVPRGHNLSN